MSTLFDDRLGSNTYLLDSLEVKRNVENGILSHYFQIIKQF